MNRLVLACGIAILVAVVSIFSVGWILARPVQRRIGEPPADLNAQSVTFQSESGAIVHGWWCPVEDSLGAVLLLPGVRANRLSMVDRAGFLRRANYSVLLIDLQGTGETKGDHITFGWKEGRDVLAAVRFIRKSAPSNRVAIIGSSLGGAAALLATPPLKVDGLVLESVYPTIEEATGNRLKIYLGPFGRLAAPLLLGQLPLRLGISANDLRPIDHVASVTCPILIMSGEKDRHTTAEETRAIFVRAKAPKDLWHLFPVLPMSIFTEPLETSMNLACVRF
jgi:alpha-beta hydrolase superfamily lysophospholipase